MTASTTDNPTTQATSYTGKPCRRCAGTLRYTSTRSCVSCAQTRRRAELVDRTDADRAQAAARRLVIRRYRAAVKAGRVEITILFPVVELQA